MKALQKTVDGHHQATNQRSRIGLWYPGRLYVSSHVDIFDIVDIDLFTAIALNMMFVKLGYTGESEPMFYNYLRALTSLDEGLCALACKKDIRCLATLVKYFKLVEVYIEHDVTALDSYIRPPWFRVTIEDITDEPSSIAANRIEKILLLTWHEFSEPTKEPVCDSVTPSSLPQRDSSTPCKDSICESITPRYMPDCMLTPPTDESVITYTQLSGVQEVDTQSHVLPTIRSQFNDINMSFVLQQATSNQVTNNVMRTREPIMAAVRTQEPIMEEVRTQEPTVEDVVLEDYSSKDACTDDEDEDFYVDEENEIVKLDVDAYLFGISMYVPFDNICVTNLVSCNVIEGDDVDVINTDGFDSKSGKDDEISNYRRRRRNLKLYKNDSVKIRARCNGKVPVFIMSEGTGPTSPNCRMEVGPSGSSGPSIRSQKRKNTGRAKSDLLVNNICEVFNGKTVRGRDKPMITLLEYIKGYCMEKIANVQSVIDKCTSPLSPTAARIMESIKKEAHFIKVQWNRANKYQFSSSLACWNMALNDRATPPPEAWVGRPKKKRKRSKHKDEPFVKDGKPSGTSVGAIIGLSAADGQCGADGTGGAGVGVGSQ
nr:hypothetical protein [Tanacetum cinerariifolium]